VNTKYSEVEEDPRRENFIKKFKTKILGAGKA
jgi:hypothetical protein